jgi:iron(III) transport system substrate-binding protein
MTITRRQICALPIPFIISKFAIGQTTNLETDIATTVAAAEREGTVLVYSVTAAENWKYVLQSFHDRYPKITVNTLDLPSGPECFERYLSESATNSRTCDLIFTQGRDQWLDFQKRGELLPYESKEAAKWPDWSKPYPGLYTPALVPVLLAWNNALVPQSQRPKTMEEFVRLATANSSSWRSRISSFTPLQGIFGYSVNYAFVERHGEKAWDWFSSLSKLTPRFERSSGPIVEKVAAGEYAAAWFVASSVLWSRLNDPVRAKIIGWSFIKDGQPIVLTGAGIPKKARNVNAAKLLLDFLLSNEGQHALGKGGITPAKPDFISDKDVPFTYKSISDAVGGEQNLILVEWAKSKDWDYDKFSTRWRSTFNTR